MHLPRAVRRVVRLPVVSRADALFDCLLFRPREDAFRSAQQLEVCGAYSEPKNPATMVNKNNGKPSDPW